MAQNPADDPREGLGVLVAQLARELADVRIEIERLQRSLVAVTRERERAAAENERLVGLIAALELRLIELEQRLRPGWFGFKGLRRQPMAPPAPPAASKAPSPDGEPALVVTDESGQPRPVLFAVLVGLSGTEIERAIEAALAGAKDAAAIPVFLTDDDEFRPFRQRQTRFEYLAPARALGPSIDEADWRLYSARRLALLARKWRPARILPYGDAAAAWLAGLLPLVADGGALAALVGGELPNAE